MSKAAENKVVPVAAEPLVMNEPILTPRSLYLQHAQETLNKANTGGDTSNLINQLLNARASQPPPIFQRSQEEEKKRQEEELRRLTQSYEETQQKHDEM